MDVRHLRCFLCVAEELHFGRAAQRLGMSQPPLSQQIRALEEELGTRLFERTSRRVRLTEVGRLFLPEARQAVAQFERAAQVARQARSGELGRLSLGFTASAPFVQVVANALYAFRQGHPHVHLALQELSHDEQITRITEGELDIGILRSFTAQLLPSGLMSARLLEEDMLLALREDHPLARRAADPTIADLADVPFVSYSVTNGPGFAENFLLLCEQAGFRPHVALEVSSFATLLGLVAAGFGATLLPQSLARLQVENVVLRRLSASLTSGLWLIHKPELSPTAQSFKEVLLAELAVPCATQANVAEQGQRLHST